MRALTSSVIKLFAAAVLVFSSSLPFAAAQEMAQPMPARPKAELSTSLSLTVNGRSLHLSPADLATLPQTRVTVHNEHLKRDEAYTGVALTDLLARAGLGFSKETEPLRYHSYLRAEGTDRYFVVFSAAEVDPALHHASVIVATQVDGHALGDEGRFKLVDSADTRPARWVRNLNALTMSTIN